MRWFTQIVPAIPHGTDTSSSEFLPLEAILSSQWNNRALWDVCYFWRADLCKWFWGSVFEVRIGLKSSRQLRVEGKGELMNWLGVQRFESEPRGQAMPSGLTLSETSMSPLRKWDSFHSLNLFLSEKLKIVQVNRHSYTFTPHHVRSAKSVLLIPKSIKP